MLEKESPLLVLSFLERKGLTTDEEMARELGLELSELIRTLLDLHQDRLVDYGRNHVRVSDRGRLFLNRCELEDAVVDDLIQEVSIRDSQRSTFHDILLAYRKDAYSQYLNSLCSTNLLRKFLREDPKIEPNKLREFDMLALSVFVLRDIRNWYSHGQLPSSFLEKMDRPTVRAITSPWSDSKHEHSDRIFEEASFFLSSAHEIVDVQYPSGRDSDRSKFLKAFRLLDDIQKAWRKDEWYDFWCDISKTLGHDNKDNRETLLDYFSSKMKNLQSDDPLREKQGSEHPGGYNWWSERLATEAEHSMVDFLANLPDLSSGTQEQAHRAEIPNLLRTWDRFELTRFSQSGDDALAAIRRLVLLMVDESPGRYISSSQIESRLAKEQKLEKWLVSAFLQQLFETIKKDKSLRRDYEYRKSRVGFRLKRRVLGAIRR